MTIFRINTKIPRFALWLPMLAAVLCCACSNDDFNPTEEEKGAEVTISVNAAPWNGAGTRAGGEGLSPITLLVVPDDVVDVEKKITITDGSDFSVRLEDGEYDLVAVCGLEADLIPDDISSEIAVPAGTDFAVGSTKVVVSNGTCTPSTVSITADRQMAWLDVTVSGVPENIVKFDLYIKEPCDNYTLDGGWWLSQSGKDKYAKIPLTKNGAVYTSSQIMMPCASASGVTYVAEATTAGGKKTTLTYTSSKPLGTGIHLTQTLSFGDLRIVEGGINLGGWNEDSDDGTLTPDDGNGGGSGSMTVGEALPGYPETTIVNVDGNKVIFVANTPLEGNIAYLAALPSKENYTHTVEIPGARWFIPQKSVEADKATAQTFLSLLLSSAETRSRLGITTNDSDVLAYIAEASNYYTFNFTTGKAEWAFDTDKSLRCFVFGETTTQ